MNTTVETPIEQSIYIPPNSISLDKVSLTQIRLGIQGYFGTGKTYGGMSFPNPVVANIDRGLGAHIGRKDIIELPLYNKDFCKKYYSSEPDNIKEALLQWIQKEGVKLTSNQTLVIDGLTGIESAYHTDWKKHPMISSRSGKVDDFAEWGLKIVYFNELTDLLITLNCHVILICHESEKKDKGTNEYTGKIRPLMSGQFADKIGGKFTDWFRQHAANKPKDFNTIDVDKIKKDWGMTPVEFKAVCDTFPRNTVYYWQTESDDTFDGKCSSLVNFPKYIPANYESFRKYMRK